MRDLLALAIVLFVSAALLPACGPGSPADQETSGVADVLRGCQKIPDDLVGWETTPQGRRIPLRGISIDPDLMQVWVRVALGDDDDGDPIGVVYVVVVNEGVWAPCRRHDSLSSLKESWAFDLAEVDAGDGDDDAKGSDD